MWNPLCVVLGHRVVISKTGSHGSRVGTVTWERTCRRIWCGWRREMWKRLPARVVREELSR